MAPRNYLMGDNLNDLTFDPDDIPADEISEFLNKSGSVELIALVDKEGIRFERMDDLLDISRSYLNKRRGEAMGLGLIKPKNVTKDGEIRRVWVLTPLGDYLNRMMERMEVTYAHKDLVRARQEYHERKRTFQDWANDPDNIQDLSQEAYERLIHHPEELPPELKRIYDQIDDNKY